MDGWSTLQEQQQLDGRKLRGLPCPKQRNSNGRLLEDSPDKVPAVVPAGKALSFPIRLGSLTMDLELGDVRETCISLSAWFLCYLNSAGAGASALKLLLLHTG